MATFEVILNNYTIYNERLDSIAKLVYDVEINFWGKKKNVLSRKIATDIRKQIATTASSE